MHAVDVHTAKIGVENERLNEKTLDKRESLKSKNSVRALEQNKCKNN